jgi:hypothetical protein
MTHPGILFSSCRSFQNGTGTDRKTLTPSVQKSDKCETHTVLLLQQS